MDGDLDRRELCMRCFCTFLFSVNYWRLDRPNSATHSECDVTRLPGDGRGVGIADGPVGLNIVLDAIAASSSESVVSVVPPSAAVLFLFNEGDRPDGDGGACCVDELAMLTDLDGVALRALTIPLVVFMSCDSSTRTFRLFFLKNGVCFLASSGPTCCVRTASCCSCEAPGPTSSIAVAIACLVTATSGAFGTSLVPIVRFSSTQMTSEDGRVPNEFLYYRFFY